MVDKIVECSIPVGIFKSPEVDASLHLSLNTNLKASGHFTHQVLVDGPGLDAHLTVKAAPHRTLQGYARFGMLVTH